MEKIDSILIELPVTREALKENTGVTECWP
jgi:hypothetical protein